MPVLRRGIADRLEKLTVGWLGCAIDDTYAASQQKLDRKTVN
jgi:hypothetical protein